MATMLPIRKTKTTLILPATIKKLNTELETLNTKRGKILNLLKESPEWREMKFREFFVGLASTYFHNIKNQPNSYIYQIDVDSLKMTSNKLFAASNVRNTTNIIFNI